MKNLYPFTHPIPEDSIDDQNYRDLANDLFNLQLRYNIDYHQQILEFGWSDDDTDYMRTALNATERLMDIAYDGSCADLKYFLFTPRSFHEDLMDTGVPVYVPEPLHSLDSAGGLCEELMAYLEPLYRQEEEDESR